MDVLPSAIGFQLGDPVSETQMVELRALAVEQLEKIAETQGIEVLIQGLDQPGWTLERSLLIEVMGKLKDAKAVAPLMGILKERSTNALHAGHALVLIVEPAIEPCIGALSSSNTDLRGSAATVLGRLRSVQAVEPLVALLYGDHNDRLSAAWALGEIGDQRAVQPLIRYMVRGEEVMNAALALEKLGDKAAILPMTEVLDHLPSYEGANVRDRLKEAIEKLKSAKHDDRTDTISRESNAM